jgi:hypothetical protein
MRTPARRALDNPIAIACLVDFAPCFPSRTWWISSLTNSPACVDGDLPSARSRRALSSVSFSGTQHLAKKKACGELHLLCHTQPFASIAGDSNYAPKVQLRAKMNGA